MSIAQKEPDFTTATRPRARTVDPSTNGRPLTRRLALVTVDDQGHVVNVDDPAVVMVGLSEIKDLFDVTKGTVYRWHTERYRSGTALPPPLLTVSRSPQWPIQDVIAFAAERGHKPKPAVLARIKKAQRS